MLQNNTLTKFPYAKRATLRNNKENSIPNPLVRIHKTVEQY